MCFISSEADDVPSGFDEALRSAVAENVVIRAVHDLHMAEIDRAGVGSLISAGYTDKDLDARLLEAERAVSEARQRLDAAHCRQQRGEAYRLLDASQGGVARSMRFRLAQNRTIASVEAHAAKPFGRRIRDADLPAVVSLGGL